MKELLKEIQAIEIKESNFNVLDSNFGKLENTHSDIMVLLLTQKNGFWNLFVDSIKEVIDLTHISNTPKIFREKYKIDILIEDGVNAVIIENKIGASDQNEQLKRYHETLKDKFKKISILYLTPFGTSPSENSKGNLDIKQISYNTHIINWLKTCLKNMQISNNNRLYVSIEMYIELIQKTINKDKYTEEVINIILSKKINERLPDEIQNILNGKNIFLYSDVRARSEKLIYEVIAERYSVDEWIPTTEHPETKEIEIDDDGVKFDLFFEPDCVRAQSGNGSTVDEISGWDITNPYLQYLLTGNRKGIEEWIDRIENKG